MTHIAPPALSRRALLSGLSALALAAGSDALAQQNGNGARVAQQPSAPPPPPTQGFTFDSLIRRARDMAGGAHEPPAALPEALAKLDFDSWRDIRFRPERALLAPQQQAGQAQQPASPFRMQMFHPGFLFNQPVVVNILRGGIPTPVPYSAQLFDYGRNKFERPLPVNLGFAGFRLHYALNQPRVFDELISFIGASYFRVLGRGQKYGLSARGASINAGKKDTEEFPHFREFWIDTPAADADRAIIYALMDSPSLTGAFRFQVYPGDATVVDVTATLFARKRVEKLGLAPLTSMFFTGENDRRYFDDFRTELHDSMGC